MDNIVLDVRSRWSWKVWIEASRMRGVCLASSRLAKSGHGVVYQSTPPLTSGLFTSTYTSQDRLSKSSTWVSHHHQLSHNGIFKPPAQDCRRTHPITPTRAPRPNPRLATQSYKEELELHLDHIQLQTTMAA